jgi:hypothetical protein
MFKKNVILLLVVILLLTSLSGCRGKGQNTISASPANTALSETPEQNTTTPLISFVPSSTTPATSTTPIPITTATVTIKILASDDLLPNVPSPWTNVKSYTNSSIKINVKTGDEFCIGVNALSRFGYSWDASYDKDIVTLENTRLIYDSDMTRSSAWCLFKSIGHGDTQIILMEMNVTQTVLAHKIFNITIEH